METFTIYFDPTDYPKKWVVRRFVIDKTGLIPDAEPLVVCDLLEDARTIIPHGYICFDRNEEDESQIVETWM